MAVQQRAPKKIPINYANGCIYKIVNDVNDILYIGSTTTSLSRRFSGHKHNAKTNKTAFFQAMNSIGLDHFRIILIEKFPCTCKAELEAREYQIMNTFAKEKLFNSSFDGRPSEEVRQKLKDNSASKGNTGRKSPSFKRGSISYSETAARKRFQFQWQDAGVQRSKSFVIGHKWTRAMAYLACIDVQNEIYPLEYEDYAQEMPFADD